MNAITNQSTTLQQVTNSTVSTAAANYLNRKPQTMQAYSQRGDIADTKDKLIAELHAEIERLTSALAASEQHRQMLWDELMWGSDSDKE